MTRLIQFLEQDLKVRLLHRTTLRHGHAGGLNLLRTGGPLAGRSRRLESTTKVSHGKPSGRVRVDIAAAIATMVLVPALFDFYKDYPDVEVEVGVGNRRSDLVAEGIDCAIRAGNISEQAIVARQIGAFRFMTCAAPAFLAAHGVPQALKDLAALPMIGIISARTGRPLPFRYYDGTAAVNIAPSNRLIVTDTNSYLAAGLAGLGVIQAPAYAVHEAVKAGRLAPLLEAWRTPVIPVHVLYAQNRYLSAKVRVFIDWAVALFERHEDLRRD